MPDSVRRARGRKRGRLSMTSLIDVIFLLLLFFMLSSTFSRFGEVTLASGAAAGNTPTPDARAPLFVRLGPDQLDLNGDDTAMEALSDAIHDNGSGLVLVSMTDQVTAQRLTDLLVVLRGLDGIQIAVLGGN